MRGELPVKKESLFFLVMVLMAAVVAGATIGIVSSFDIIVDRINVMNSEAQTMNTEIADGEEAANPAVVTEKSPPAADQPTAYQGTSGEVSSSTPSSDIMVVTSEEKAQITEMLHELGMPQGADYNQFIKQFQQQQAIPATGSLDSWTLRVIINKTTEQKARECMQ